MKIKSEPFTTSSFVATTVISGKEFFMAIAFSIVRFVIVNFEGGTARDSTKDSIKIFPIFPVPINPIFKFVPPLQTILLTQYVLPYKIMNDFN